MNCLPPALLLVFWLLLDFTGILLSVISTTFYFGWAGLSLLVVRIFLTALLAFSAPLAYRLFFWRLPQGPVLKILVGIQFALYLAISFNRDTQFFAWAVVAGTWVSGLALMAIFRNFSGFKHPSLSFIALMFSVFLYLGSRVSNQGLALFFFPPSLNEGSPLAWITVLIFALATLFLPAPLKTVSESEKTSPLWLAEFYGLPLGPLLGLSVGLIYNLHIWSARTSDYQASVYFLSLILGCAVAWFVFLGLKQKRFFVIPIASFTLAVSLYCILLVQYQLATGLAAHFMGSFGLGLFWLVYLTRYQAFSQSKQDYFPVWGLQLGFVAFLLILAIFLLQSNPKGFWLAWLMVSAVLALAEYKNNSLPFEPGRLQRIWLFSLFCFFLPGILALFIRERSDLAQAVAQPVLRIMSTNIRYGWTDTYRFDPFPHVQWLKAHPVDILGIQEVNKGHTSGAYSDLFRLYQQAMPGHWRYADANYGFGNALMTHFPILSSETRTYQAKDMLRRSCLKATLAVGKNKIDVYVTHLSHLPPPNPVREAQVQELQTWIRESQNPWIVIGDFNAHPDSAEVQSLLKLAHPVFSQNKQLLQTLSFPSLQPQERIDYIFFSSQFSLRNQEIPATEGSTDHRPILTELILP
ncbi:hypothetical protein COW36_13375 [bacterium (Candidatus Blackallbacteria) CG17_big_fil_post_rev_8_21_14_2_50_48_46]|uniref:Endonuclease/exonuclease/phosphatase domain-containing protein n=1 Tax=bacterium (Candidatus Blackallbacteria) CG17_big_fil_post_rev_8_21_14_2_50_48_46 TaxID=2014261 RepID=A0A2M7G3B5_9BACT|nr:MAG: hypothetical protein COW64_21995 [bacterium (Candidatus Blackallbacteria) CG18_big_fil_WC_8_21_14_2_50_49_26]PIW16320.1 MAG: hypothetical protein COW36_13375 [bacterium (Candidatus Blackallbacteria) CG17_big_fil_post_rev_8_21_14_2_50_48_46]PIW45334.1 MAG: hypothetical protein COW20_20610 [bacterium (Candidatus Blackallbacteria) CG13_big_fil_rev_8_21_14_2_50_49_14]